MRWSKSFSENISFTGGEAVFFESNTPFTWGEDRFLKFLLSSHDVKVVLDQFIDLTRGEAILFGNQVVSQTMKTGFRKFYSFHRRWKHVYRHTHHGTRTREPPTFRHLPFISRENRRKSFATWASRFILRTQVRRSVIRSLFSLHKNDIRTLCHGESVARQNNNGGRKLNLDLSEI